MLNLKTVAAAALVAFVASGTNAAVCPDEEGYGSYFTLETDAPIGNTCYAWGENNDQNDADFKASILADFGYTNFIGKINDIENSDNFVPEGAYASLLDGMADLLGGIGGTFTIDLTGWTNVLLVFKVGGGPYEPAFAAFLIDPTGIVNGEWSTDRPQGLSHVSIYGTPAPIPLPAAGFLMLGALGALGVAARRRKA